MRETLLGNSLEKMRILFTGGSGKAGKHVIPELLALVLNVDLDTAQDKILHTLHP